MKAWKLAASLAAVIVLFAGQSWAETSTQDGQSSRGVQQGKWISVMDPADSTGVIPRGTKTQGMWVYMTNAPQFAQAYIGNVYEDTMSVNGRSLDSLAAPIDVSKYRSIALHFKMNGHHGVAAGKVRIGVQARWLGGSANDTTMTWSSGVAQNVPVTAAALDSAGALGGSDVAANTASAWERVVVLQNFTANASAAGGSTLPVRTTTLGLVNPGAKYLWLIFRVLSDTGTTATQGYKFRLRVDAQGAAL